MSAAEAIKTVAVIGAGTMGAGIAAHCANAGCQVLLLDIVPKDSPSRSKIAAEAVGRLGASRPPALADPAFASRITPGNVEDDLGRAAACDLVIEAVSEDLAIKRSLYARLAELRRSQTIIASNTSTLALADLVGGQPEAFARHLLVTHFFNPPRVMRLLELVAGPQTDAAVVARVSAFCDHSLGKEVIVCRDRPGFIANRLGTFWIAAAVSEARRLNIEPEDADAALGKPFGVPATGIFGLLDLIGIDLLSGAMRTLLGTLPPEDPLHSVADAASVLDAMVAQRLLGRKTGGGFYRQRRTESGKVSETFVAAAWRATRPAAPETAQVGDIDAEGPLADFAWRVMGQTFAYACRLVPDVTASPTDVDAAMRLGYGWREGPFELMDRYGADRVITRLEKGGLDVPLYLASAARRGGFRTTSGVLVPQGERIPPTTAPGLLKAADCKQSGAPLAENESAVLWDMGDGVGLFELRTKMNTLNEAVFNLLSQAVAGEFADLRALVIGGDGPNFSAGADIREVAERVASGQLSQVERTIRLGQRVFLDMKYGTVPVVGACAGLALGGGCELLMHCVDAQVHLDACIGLVETHVGVLPATGGTTQMLIRHAARQGDAARGAVEAFNVIAPGLSTSSAPLAKRAGLLADNAGITMNRDRLLADAKKRALTLVGLGKQAYRPRVTIDRSASRDTLEPAIARFIEANADAPHSATVAREIAWVLSGGDGTGRVALAEEDLHALEVSAFLRLIATQQSQARIRHMLENGKPLKN
jgi:3-hydroxyacyl-CoA dehydrogenase